MRMVAVLGFALLAACATPEDNEGCMATGCSREICSDQPEFSPCIWVEANQCYRDAICARQASGACEWKQTPALTQCLATHRREP